MCENDRPSCRSQDYRCAILIGIYKVQDPFIFGVYVRGLSYQNLLRKGRNSNLDRLIHTLTVLGRRQAFLVCVCVLIGSMSL